jgi:DUF1680 family protein
MAQLPGLVYATRGRDLFVNLYVDSDATATVGDARVRIRQLTNYPWDGVVRLDVSANRPIDFTLKLRAPGWLGPAPFASDLYRYETPIADVIRYSRPGFAGQAEPASGWIDVRVNLTAAAVAEKSRVSVRLNVPMPVRRVRAHAGIADNAGKAAIQRGPIVYALEGIDNDGAVLDATIPASAVFAPAFRPDLLGGVTVLTATTSGPSPRTLTAIPYYAWANRGRGEMVVWGNLKSGILNLESNGESGKRRKR